MALITLLLLKMKVRGRGGLTRVSVDEVGELGASWTVVVDMDEAVDSDDGGAETCT